MKKMILSTLLLLSVGLSFGSQLPEQEERALVRREMAQEQPTAEQRAQAYKIVRRKVAKKTACICACACTCATVTMATTAVAVAFVILMGHV